MAQLTDTRLKLILKGTYESNSPFDQFDVYVDDGLKAEADATAMDGTQFETDFTDQATTQLVQYIDLAEVRIARGDGLSVSGDPDDYYTFFARERILMCSSTDALEGKKLETCEAKEGLNRLTEFMSGGITFPSVSDVAGGIYTHLAIYFRRIVTATAYEYNSFGTRTLVREANFDNRKVGGLDIENTYQYAFSDDQDVVNPRLFPLEKTDLFLEVPGGDKEFVIEARVFLKNSWMKHLIKDSASNFLHFIGPSDMKSGHKYADPSEQGFLGGNFIMTARLYEPENVGNITITTATDVSGFNASGNSKNSGLHYYAALYNGQTFDPAEIALPPNATRGSLTSGESVTITNLPPSTYDIVLLCDQTHNLANGATSDGPDGYPETLHSSCGTAAADIVVTAGATVTATTTCVCDSI